MCPSLCYRHAKILFFLYSGLVVVSFLHFLSFFEWKVTDSIFFFFFFFFYDKDKRGAHLRRGRRNAPPSFRGAWAENVVVEVGATIFSRRLRRECERGYAPPSFGPITGLGLGRKLCIRVLYKRYAGKGNTFSTSPPNSTLRLTTHHSTTHHLLLIPWPHRPSSVTKPPTESHHGVFIFEITFT